MADGVDIDLYADVDHEFSQVCCNFFEILISKKYFATRSNNIWLTQKLRCHC